jgi:hypothetical protein
VNQSSPTLLSICWDCVSKFMIGISTSLSISTSMAGTHMTGVKLPFGSAKTIPVRWSTSYPLGLATVQGTRACDIGLTVTD